MRRSSGYVVVPFTAIAACLLLCHGATAQVAFESGQANYSVSASTFFDGMDCDDPRNDSLTLIPGGLPFTVMDNAICSSGAYSAEASASTDIMLEEIPNGFGGSGVVTASTNQAFPAEFEPFSNVSSRAGGGFFVVFEVESEATLTVTGMLVANATAPSRVRINHLTASNNRGRRWVKTRHTFGHLDRPYWRNSPRP
jgi:hypothetical protein